MAYLVAGVSVNSACVWLVLIGALLLSLFAGSALVSFKARAHRILKHVSYKRQAPIIK